MITLFLLAIVLLIFVTAVLAVLGALAVPIIDVAIAIGFIVLISNIIILIKTRD